MRLVDTPATPDRKTIALRLWWGRAVLAFTAATFAAFAVRFLSWVVDGGASRIVAYRTFFDSPTFWIDVLYTTVLAPFVEMGLMARIIDLLLRQVQSRALVILVTAGLAAAVHRLFTNEAGWYALLPFVAFSFVYIRRSGEPHHDGFIVAAMSQAFFNATDLLSMTATAYTR